MNVGSVLVNVNALIDGRGMVGQIDRLQLPALEWATQEYQAGGLGGTVRLPIGLQPIECMLSLHSVNADVAATWGLKPRELVNWIMRGALQQQDGAVVAAVATIGAWTSKLDWGDWRRSDKTTCDVTAQVRRYKLEIAGRVVHEIDVDNNVLVVDGTDVAEAERQALGI